jgi:hypothetical protein
LGSDESGFLKNVGKQKKKKNDKTGENARVKTYLMTNLNRQLLLCLQVYTVVCEFLHRHEKDGEITLIKI